MKAWLRLWAQRAVRQRMRRREFRFRLRPAGGDGVEVEVHARSGGFAARFALRGGTSDVRTFAQIYLDEQYNLRRLDRWPEIEAGYHARRIEGATPLVLDLGANIGLSAQYFTHLFPGARVMAVEPDPGNFARLRAHLAGCPAILPLEAAATSRDGRVNIVNPDGPTAGRRTETVGTGGAIAAFSINSLLERAAVTGEVRPWLAKIDIEGAEQELFAENLDWLDQFPLVIIEPHDWTIPGSSRSFRRALLERDRDLLVVGESLLAMAPGIAG